MISEALSTGAQVFICGEIGYHPTVSHQGQALTLVEVGHYSSEKWVIPVLAQALREANQAEDWEIDVLEDVQPGDPYVQYF